MNLDAVDRKLAEIEAEQAEAAAAEAEANKSVFDKAKDFISNLDFTDFSQNVQQAMKGTYGSYDPESPSSMYVSDTMENAPLGTIEDVVGGGVRDFTQAVSDANQARLDLLQQGVNMQQAYRDAQETGDYSAFEEQVDTLKESGKAATLAMAKIPAAPFRQAARNFIQNNVNDNNSPYQGMAESLQQTDVAMEYFSTNQEKVQQAREIEAKTQIPADVILRDNDAYRAALDVYNYMKKEDDIESAWEAYPEIKGIADLDPQAAVVALHDMDSVRKTHGVVEAFTHFLEKGNDDLEYNNIQYKIMDGTATEEDRARAAELEAKMRADKKKAPGFFQDPLSSMAAGVAQSLPEMGAGLAEGGKDAMITTTAAVAFTVLTGGTDLLVVGGLAAARAAIMRALASQGVKTVAKGGFQYGMAKGMGKAETGRAYAEMSAEKKEDGTPLYTEDEKRLYAPLRGYTNAVIETLNITTAGKAMGINSFAEKAFAQSVGKIVARNTGKETLQTLAMDKAGDFAKLTLTESGEEALQSMADDIIVNAARDSKGADAAHLGTYSAGDILRRGTEAFIESLPGSMGFGLMGVGVGSVAGAGRLARARRRAAAADTEAERLQQQTLMGGMMVEQLRNAVREGKLQKVAPDVQRSVIKEQLKDTGFENSYIDVEMALKNEHGKEDLQKVAKAQGMSAEELEAAISVQGFIPVNTEALCQAEASPALLDAVSFSPEAESLARMQENARAIAEEYSKNAEKTLERQLQLVDTVVNEYIPGATKEQREALRGAVLANPHNPAQGWNLVYKEYRNELDELLRPALDALKAGMGKAGIMDVQDENGNVKTTRYTENDEWYRNFYKQFKRQPTKAELEDMAIAMVTGDPSAPQVAGWVPDSAEMQAEMEQNKSTIAGIKQGIADLEAIKGEVKKLTGVEMELTEGLSPEAFKVYRAISAWNEKAGGKVARQGRIAAILVARHADLVADAVRRKTGRKYTAEDYIKERVGLQLVESGQDFEVGLQQMAETGNRQTISVKAGYIKAGNGEKPIQKALEWFGSKYPYGAVVSTVVGDVHLTKSGIKGSLSHGLSQKKLDVVPTLEAGLKQAEYIKTISDYKDSRIKNHFFVYQILYDGEPNYVLCRVREQEGYGKLYVHEVANEEEIKKELPPSTRDAALKDNRTPGGATLERAPFTTRGTAKGGIAPRGVVLYKSILQEYLEKVNSRANSPINKAVLLQRAWHGTPHDFAKFDLGAIGSGEGGQAHGWGLYFAGDKEVSERYKERLSAHLSVYTVGREKYTISDNRHNMLDKNGNVVEDYKQFFFDELRKTGNKEDAIKALKEKAKDWRKDGYKAEAALFTKAAQWAKSKEVNIDIRDGKLFEVEIPDDDVLLDEQKKFGEQPEKVQAALRKLISESETAKKHPAFAEQIYEVDGRRIYGIVSGLAEGDAPKGVNLDNINRLGSELLNEYGIKGITYNGGQDGRCYVVFDDKAISVIEKFNQEARQGGTKGSIAPDPQEQGRKIISILETADESTFMHEMAHMFLFDLEDLANIDETSAKELEIVNQWAEWHEGAAREYKGTAWAKEFADREQAIIDAEAHGFHERADSLKYEWKQERFARAFELYLKDGQAPARGLRAVFRMFKQFLRIIYKAFTGDGGKASEPVRRVMDRMIATEEEIEAAALEDRYRDVLQAGGEKLFDEEGKQTMARWLEEEKEAAKEKVSKLVMADLEQEKQEEFNRKLEKERQRYTHELQQEDIHVARRAAEIAGSKDIVTEWFDSVEAYDWADEHTPSLESLVDAHMAEYRETLDKELIESHLSPEAIAKAMESSHYRQKLEAYVLRGMEKKKALINRINVKARRAMDSIEEKLQALPEDIDMKVEKFDPRVKDIMKEVNRLRFAGKWTTADINHIEAMMRASTQAEVRDAIKALKEKQQAEKRKEQDITQVTKGQEKFFRDMVKKTTESQPMTETCNVRYYIEKERQAGRRVRAMLKIDNWDMAVQQQRQKMYYSMMVKQARENKEEKERLVKDLEKKARARTVRLPKDERYWFNHLLYLMRIAKTDIKEPEGGAKKLSALFEEQINSLDMLYTPDKLMAIAEKGENYGDYQQMSLREFKDVCQDLTRLYTIGRDKFRLKTVDGKNVEDVLREILAEEGTIAGGIETVVRKITPDTGGLAYLDALGSLGSAGDRVAKGVQQYVESGLKPENLIKMLGKKAHKYIYGTLEKAAEKEAKLSADNLAALQKICGVYTHAERQAWDREVYDFAPARGRKISKENILCMALNWGTDTNRQRLLGGLIADGQGKNNTGEETIRQEVEKLFQETMTKKDWEFIQALWDHLDSFWAETTATEEKLNGVALEKVAPSAFEIKTADGQTVKLKGGYMHIKYDPDKSARAEEQEVEDAARSMMGAARMGTGRSFTKGRSEYSIYRPLQLNFGVIEQHLQEVIHNIAFRVPLRDVYRLLHYSNFKDGLSLEEHLRRTLGVEAYRNIDQWALDAWKRIDENRNSADTAIKKITRAFRGSSTLSIMGMRLWPCVENISNVAVGMDKLGAGGMLTALMDFYKAPQGNLKKVRDLSIFMRSRADNLDRDLRNQPGLFHADNKLMELARNHAYDLMVYSDLMVSAPIWLRSYKDAFQPKIEEVKRENDENIRKRLELVAKVDEIKGRISDHLKASADIDAFMRTRRYGSAEEVEALSDSEYSGLGDGELRATGVQHQKDAKGLNKELWQAETELQQALEVTIYDEAEIVTEAERRAALEADGAIRDTFGSGRNIDLPAVMRSRNEFVQLFTAFYGFFNTQYNALYMAYMESKYLPPESHIFKWAPLAKAALYRVVLTSLISTTLAFGLGLQGDSKDDKEKTVLGADGKKEKAEIPANERFLKVWAKNMVSTTTGGLYGIRDLTGIAADMIITGNARDYSLGSVVTRSIAEGWKTIQLLSRKGAKDAEIQAQQEKREREHQEKLKKYKGKQRQEYLQKWEEEQKYRKPPARITYAEIAGHAGKAISSATASKTGITSTAVNAVTSTMQYMLDSDERFDASLKNIIWSAAFDKKPVEREIPEKPAKPKEEKKGKKTRKAKASKTSDRDESENK